MLDMPLRDMVILSTEEASTQNTCENLPDISSINLRQIWVFPTPPVPQRRQEHLDINSLSAEWIKIFRSLSSTSFWPTNKGLVFGFWSTGIFIWVLAGRMLLFWQIRYVINCFYSLQERLTTKMPPVISGFWAFAKKPEPEPWIWQSWVTAKSIWFKQLTEKFCSDITVDTCIIASGNEGNSGLWVAEYMF